jgi:hypothetical protein
MVSDELEQNLIEEVMVQLGRLSVTYLDAVKGLWQYKSELQESGSSFGSSTTPNRSVIKMLRFNNYHTIAINGDSEISSSSINNLILHNLRKISFQRIYETDPLSCIAFFLFCKERWKKSYIVSYLLPQSLLFLFLERLFWILLFHSKSWPDINKNKKESLICSIM